MKKLSVFIFLIPLFGVLNAHNDWADNEVMFLPHGRVLRSLCGFGYSPCTKTTISNISCNNPASLCDFSEYMIGLSYQFDTKVDPAWGFGIGHDRIINGYPQSGGFVMPIHNFRLGLGIGQRYNSSLDLGKILIITAENPYGTGEYYTPTYHTYVMNYSVLVACFFQNIFKEDDRLSLGFQYDLNRFYHKEILGGMHFDAASYEGSWSIGFRYYFNVRSNSGFHLGLFYENGVKFRKSTEVNVQPPSYLLNDQFITLVGALSDKIYVGFLTRTSLPIDFMLNITHVNMKENYDYYKNYIEFSGSTILQLTHLMTASFGFFFTSHKFEEGSYYWDDFLNGYYMTGGFIYELGNFEIDFSVADSHLMSGNWRMQTIGKIGIGFTI